MPPPPCELLVNVMPSTRDGLHRKLLEYVVQSALLAVSGTQTPLAVQFGSGCSRPTTRTSRTPFASTVMPAPSYAPINAGSISNSPRLPLSVLSQPSVGSSGIASTWRCIAAGHEYVPDGSYGLPDEIAPPLIDTPNR